MKFINHDTIFRLLDEKQCIGVMRKALENLEQKRGEQYLRTPYSLPGGNIFAFMPAWLDDAYFGAKVLTVFHGNNASGYPSHQGGILLFEAGHGTPVAFVDASAITQIRTGAVSALATDLLARPDASRLALLGCGSQAISHLRAIRHVRRLTHVTVWDIRPGQSEAFASRMSEETGICVEAKATVQETVAAADILCTLTPSPTPILQAEWVRAGTHINAVGACRPTEREIPSLLMAKARVFGDSIESVLKESGDFLVPLQEGLFAEDHLLNTIGALALGSPGRQSAQEITLFEALGLAIEDIAAARFVFEAEK